MGDLRDEVAGAAIGYRADPSRDRATGGAGLGLAMARQLVRAWNGTIGVDSEPGSGTTFWFTVPHE